MKSNRFKDTVKQVYQTERKYQKDQEIAEAVGIGKSRLSQLLNEPAGFTVPTMRRILAPIRTPEFRRHMVEAWYEVCFDLTPASRPVEAQPEGYDPVSETYRLMNAHRYRMAAAVAETTLTDAEGEAAEWLRDQVIECYHKLNEMGKAMEQIAALAYHARERGDRHRLVTANYFAAKVRIDTENLGLKATEHLLEQVRKQLVLAAVPPPPEEPRYLLVSEGTIINEIFVRYLAKGKPGDHPRLDENLTAWREDVTKDSDDISASLAYNLAQVAYFFGESYGANEWLEIARQKTQPEHLAFRQTCRILKGRIAAMSNLDRALRHFDRAITACQQSELLLLKRIAEQYKTQILFQKMQ